MERVSPNEMSLSSLEAETGISIAVQLLNCVELSVTPWTATHQAPLSPTLYWSLFRFIPIESVTLSNHLILCCPLLLLTAVFHSIISISKIIEKYLFHCVYNLTSRSSVL